MKSNPENDPIGSGHFFLFSNYTQSAYRTAAHKPQRCRPSRFFFVNWPPRWWPSLGRFPKPERLNGFVPAKDGPLVPAVPTARMRNERSIVDGLVPCNLFVWWFQFNLVYSPPLSYNCCFPKAARKKWGAKVPNGRRARGTSNKVETARRAKKKQMFWKMAVRHATNSPHFLLRTWNVALVLL